MRILFLTSTRIGDAVLSSGALAWIIEQNPGARVTLGCGAAPVPLFRSVPEVERVLAIEKRRYGGHWVRLWREVAGKSWDLVVDLRGSVIAWLLRARRRIVHRPDLSLRHRVVQISELIGAPEPLAPRLWLDERAVAAARNALPPGGGILALGPTANWERKCWPAERFAELAQRLTHARGMLPRARIALFGAQHERAAIKAITDALPADRTVDLVGKIDLPTVAACLARADLFVGNDSGLMHIAAAAGSPTVGLFGPSRTEHYSPWGRLTAAVRTPQGFEELSARPEFAQPSGGSLLAGLTVDTVESEVERLLQSARAATFGSTPVREKD